MSVPRVVGASAGSGKTYRLTEAVIAAVTPSTEAPIAVEGLVAVTFTRRAASELTSRIRQALLDARAPERALELPIGYVGTVHAVCLRLIQELAIDAGLAPTVDVLVGDGRLELRRALESAIEPTRSERLTNLGRRFQIENDWRKGHNNWIYPVREIMDLARSNRISPDRLDAMAERSVAGLHALLPPPSRDGEALDRALSGALDEAIAAVEAADDTTVVTSNALDAMRDLRKKLRWGPLPWAAWAKLASLKSSVASQPLVDALQQAASAYEHHPRLHDEIRELVTGIYACARAGLEAYGDWKARRRVVDYVDMLDRALRLLENDEVARELGDRLELVVVDELQDTSPIQLALFVRLHQLAGRSTWVGDPKQCIFEFAGADPRLMESVIRWAGGGGQLGKNYRSRPELVAFTSELFAAALAPHGFARSEVVVAAHRSKPDSLLPPLGAWWLTSSKAATDVAAIANGVARMLARPDETRITDRETGNVRDVVAGDIAILVATNREAEALADALHRRGIRAALARDGLLSTGEGTLADAGLRLLLDERDTLARANIEALLGFEGINPDAWLESKLASVDSEPPWLSRLARWRDRMAILSPSEALEGVLDALDATTVCSRWPDAPQRLGNLDALRRMACEYEELSASHHEAATIAGMLHHFEQAREEAWDGAEMRARDEQHFNQDEGAVVICTYHKAKGLEWPVVVMASLARDPRRDAFGVQPESDVDAFDPNRPLEGRWIRYWPWPLGPQTAAPLGERAATSNEGQRVAEQERKERARLLYVGMTRARDHLVFAARVKKGTPQMAWVDELADESGPLLRLDLDGAVVRAQERERTVALRTWTLGPDQPTEPVADREPRRFSHPAGPAPERPPFAITPSRAADDWPEAPRLEVAEIVHLHDPLTLSGSVAWEIVGTAIHGFLAADIEGLSPEARRACAHRLLAAADLVDRVSSEALVGISDALRAFITTRWPDATWSREIPVAARMATPVGDRRIAGVIDLLLENHDHAVVIDHKSFPVPHEAVLQARALEIGPQIAAYRQATVRTLAKPVECWIHFALAGKAICLREGDAARSTTATPAT